MVKKLTISSLLLLPFGLLASVQTLPDSKNDLLPTYFIYTAEEIDGLKTLSSEEVITESEIQKWDPVMAHFLDEEKVDSLNRLRFYTYLYTAERDAAFLSYNTHDHFEGSLDPLILGILQLFFSNFTPPQEYTTDLYSEKLASTVLPYYQRRFEREEGAALKEEPDAIVAHWIPWIVRPIFVYRPESPFPEGDKAWSAQIKQLNKRRKNLTPEQIERAQYWDQDNTQTWREILNAYIVEEDIPLAQALLVRSVLMMGLTDATLAAIEAKYHYQVKRPYQHDPSLITHVEPPTTPSYPSGHATSARAAETILTYYFPDDSPKWQALAAESSESRLLAGVHYPIDVEAGQKLGRDIACEVIICEEEAERETLSHWLSLWAMLATFRK